MECYAVSNKSISKIRQQVREEIETVASEVSPSVIDDVMLATGEVATNVVKHCGEQNDGIPLKIWFTEENDCLIEHIKTESHCANKELIEMALGCNVCEKCMESVSIDREGGMGLAIIGAITKDRRITSDGEMILAFAL